MVSMDKLGEGIMNLRVEDSREVDKGDTRDEESDDKGPGQTY